MLTDVLGWPPGAVETCVAIEQGFPGWVVWYYPAEPGGLSRWAVTRESDRDRLVGAADEDELRVAIEAAQAGLVEPRA